MLNKNIWRGRHGPLLIAEIGGNHEGNFNYAKKLVKLAISTGVDVVKLQIYSGSGLVSRIESKKDSIILENLNYPKSIILK